LFLDRGRELTKQDLKFIVEKVLQDFFLEYV